MRLFASEQLNPTQIISKERKRAEDAEAKVERVQLKSGRYLALVLADLRNNLRSGRERRIISREERRVRIKNKWGHLLWRNPRW